MRASCSVSRGFYSRALPAVEVSSLEGVSMAQAFVNSKIQPGKVVVFIKPTCPYCKKTQELLSQLPFKQGLLEFVDITANGDTSEIQDYLQQLTGARTVPRVFIGEECIGGCTDLVNMHERGELLTRLKQIGALE
ncbi:glutaredoxin-1 [Moschus berezovskii]|uniref:Glutaredoxin-1 n=1 Tax=Moschus moschiferus TaxID=68415 RepID=A0A8C6CSE3_MOSMO|nr:glutaredoxin-1 [Moschus berezovskii]XP_055285412.1 glutaredoxin-1 [Moschus berezovskii]